jgi:hypothetical protein
MLDNAYPALRYMQGTDATCLFSSFASALHFGGLRITAEKIAAMAPCFSMTAENGKEAWAALKSFMLMDCSDLVPRTVYGVSFNVFNDISVYPTVLQLVAKDGNQQHAVTIVGKMVFDSNVPRALPLTKATMDYCCSSDDQASEFYKIYTGVRFEEPEEKKNKVWRVDEVAAKCRSKQLKRKRREQQYVIK